MRSPGCSELALDEGAGLVDQAEHLVDLPIPVQKYGILTLVRPKINNAINPINPTGHNPPIHKPTEQPLTLLGRTPHQSGHPIQPNLVVIQADDPDVVLEQSSSQQCEVLWVEERLDLEGVGG